MAALVVSLIGAGAAGGAGTGTIKGKVTALVGGAAIQGVEVCGYQLGGGEEEAICRSSKADGTYSLTGLSAGDYIVEFWAGSGGLNYITQYFDNKEFFEEADEVTVNGGGTVENVNAQLKEGGEIKGTVTAAGDGPVENVEVCAFVLEGEEFEFGGCGMSDENGEYAIARLRGGEYTVEFWPASGGWNYLTQFYDHKANPAEANRVTVAPGEVKAGIDAELEPGAGIEGTVFSASSGAPVPETRVCVLNASTEELARGCVNTSGVGRYKFVGLSPGAYQVAFSPELKEFFPELFELFPEFFESEDDGYLTQFYNGKTTLAAADTLNLTPPTIRSGIDAHLAKPSPPAPPAVTVRPLLKGKPKPALHCRKGFKKKRVKGKLRCVRVHRRKHHPATGRGRIPARLLLRVR